MIQSLLVGVVTHENAGLMLSFSFTTSLKKDRWRTVKGSCFGFDLWSSRDDGRDGSSKHRLEIPQGLPLLLLFECRREVEED